MDTAKVQTRKVTLRPGEIVIDGERWRALSHLLHTMAELVDTTIQEGDERWLNFGPPKRKDNGRSSAEPDA